MEGRMRTPRTLAIFTALVLLTTSSLAGIRGPGNYAGVVLFDRWGTCYLFSGVYLMYISSKESAKLHKFAGKSILINAKKVYQPINPGDGLISSFDVIGEPSVNPYQPEARSLNLRLEGDPSGASNGKAQLIVHNTSAASALIDDDLGLALLGVKGNSRFSPSDGDSDAWLTRQHLKTIEWGDRNQWHIKVDDADLMKLHEEVPAGGKVIIHMQIRLPPGKYNLVCGYGGDVHEYYCAASNLLAITVASDKVIAFK
jgi:hypothetical protein